MFFRICNLENCLNHKRIKQWPTRKKQTNRIKCMWCLEEVSKAFGKRFEAVLLTALNRSPDFFISPASRGLSLSWHVHGLEIAEALTERLSDCFTARPALFLRSPLANYPNCMRDKNFPQSVRISKAQSTTFRQCFKWHIVQKVVFVESIFALWSGNK